MELNVINAKEAFISAREARFEKYINRDRSLVMCEIKNAIEKGEFRCYFNMGLTFTKAKVLGEWLKTLGYQYDITSRITMSDRDYATCTVSISWEEEE